MGDGRAIARASAAWGDDMPASVRALAEACDRSSQGRVAATIRRRDGRGHYSPTVINQVLGRAYPGDMDAVLAAVSAALIADAWECPGVGGEISAEACWDWQVKARADAAATSSHRMAMRRACKDCPVFQSEEDE
ncbi:hypothetical protein [uncultured Rhodospira sp.]|uniref:hypothetical protein n=1 Tax=uncultured Rhodospira sp. TaxID=1936189 RepID=UPI002606DB44|nr:hypothetical protein [uncultured Rhodospira sp.]